MFTSPKRLIRTHEGKVVEAGPGVSGSLVVAAGSQIREDLAIELGLMPGKGMPRQPGNMDSEGLRTDGPTIEEWVKAGYPADNYPPRGYAEKPSQGLNEHKAQKLAPGEMTTASAEQKKPWLDETGKERTDSSASGLSLGGESEGKEDQTSALPKNIHFGAQEKKE